MTADGADEDDSLLRYLNSVSHQVLALLDLDGRLGQAPPSAPNNKQHLKGTKQTKSKKSSAKSSSRRQQETKVDEAKAPAPASSEGQPPKPRKRPPRIRPPRASIRKSRGKRAQEEQHQDKAKCHQINTSENFDQSLREQQPLLEPQAQLPLSSQQHHLSTTCNSSSTSSSNNNNNNNNINIHQQQSHQHQQPLYMSEHQSAHVIVASGEPLHLGDGTLTLSGLNDELGHQLVVAGHELSPLTDSHQQQQQQHQHNHSTNAAYYSPPSVYDDLVLAPSHAQSQFNPQPTRPSQESDNYGHHLVSPQPANNIHLQQHQPPALILHPIMTVAHECYQEPQPPAYSHQHQQQPGGHNHQLWLSPLLGGHESTAQTMSDERAQQQQQQQQHAAGYQPAQVYQQQQSYYHHHEHNPFHPASGSGHHNHHNHELIVTNNDQSVGISKTVSTSPPTGEQAYHHHDLDDQQQHLIDPNQHDNHHDHHHHHHHHQDHHHHQQQHLHSAHFHHGHHHNHHLMGPSIGLVNGIEPSSVILQDINLASASWSSPEDLYSI